MIAVSTSCLCQMSILPAIIVDSFVRKGKLLPHLKCCELLYHLVLLLKLCTSLSSQEWFNWSMARGHTTSFTNFVLVLLQFLKVGLSFFIIPHNFLKVEFSFWLILILSVSIIVTPCDKNGYICRDIVVKALNLSYAFTCSFGGKFRFSNLYEIITG